MDFGHSWNIKKVKNNEINERAQWLGPPLYRHQFGMKDLAIPNQPNEITDFKCQSPL